MAPAELLYQLIAAVDVQCLYRKDKNQVTIWATITPSTPATVAALLADPCTDNPGTGLAEPVSSPAQGPIGPRSKSEMARPARHLTIEAVIQL